MFIFFKKNIETNETYGWSIWNVFLLEYCVLVEFIDYTF